MNVIELRRCAECGLVEEPICGDMTHAHGAAEPFVAVAELLADLRGGVYGTGMRGLRELADEIEAATNENEAQT